jgi:crotonobetainyl-CoA:carnitine CoA-transferase CaiB-like acyl-CoA transferase
MTGFPYKFSETPTQVRQSAPNFGQHTEEIMQEVLGASWEEIEKLKTEEVI